MNAQPVRERPVLAYAIGIVGTFLIIAGLVWGTRRLMQPPPVEDRAAVRAKALAELRAAEADELNNTGWVDQGKGLVRLRVQDAMNLIEREWSQNPAAARSNLISRVEKATAPPPKAPEKPSQFE